MKFSLSGVGRLSLLPAALAAFFFLSCGGGGSEPAVAPVSSIAPATEVSSPVSPPDGSVSPAPAVEVVPSAPASDGSGSPSPVPPLAAPAFSSARGLLEASARAMTPLRSVHYELVVSSSLDKPGDFMNIGMRMSGDFEPPDRWLVKRVRRMGSLDLETFTLAVGADRYVREAPSREWSRDTGPLDSGSTPLGLLAPGFDGAWVSGLDLLHPEELDGVMVYRLAGDVPLDALEDMLTRADFGGRSASIEYWVGAEDLMVYRVRSVVEGVNVFSASGPEPFHTSLDMRLSRYGEEFGILLPGPGEVSGLPGLVFPTVPSTLSGEAAQSTPVPVPDGEVAVVVPARPPGGIPAGYSSPREIILASRAAMESAGSFRYEASLSSDMSVESLGLSLEMEMTGEFQFPDRESVVADVSIGPLSIRVEVISIGSDSYIRDPFTGEWELDSGGSGFEGAPGGFAGPFLGGPDEAEFLGSVVLVGEEILNGTPVYHLGGDVSPGLLESLDPVGGSVLHSGSVDYWIGVDDLLIHRLSGSVEILDDVDPAVPDEGGAAPDGEKSSVRAFVEMVFSDHGAEVDIQRPGAESVPSDSAPSEVFPPPSP